MVGAADKLIANSQAWTISMIGADKLPDGDRHSIAVGYL